MECLLMLFSVFGLVFDGTVTVVFATRCLSVSVSHCLYGVSPHAVPMFGLVFDEMVTVVFATRCLSVALSVWSVSQSCLPCLDWCLTGR